MGRCVATAFAALWLALPVSAVLHSAHGHELCAEHGVLEERTERPRDSADREQRAGRSRESELFEESVERSSGFEASVKGSRGSEASVESSRSYEARMERSYEASVLRADDPALSSSERLGASAHEACSFLATLTAPALAELFPVAVVLPSPCESAQPLRDVLVIPSLSLLSVAPKSSPPAFAV